jgi:GNAT superfamily N-acetyltransferase
MRIVPAVRTHIAGLVELMTGSPLLRRYGVTSARARASLVEALREHDVVLVALEGGGEIVGLAWVITTRALDRGAYLRLLLVAEGRQSHGVGAALLAEAERAARSARCRHLVLLVTTTNRRARAFYTREGYRHVGNLPGFVHPAIGESLYVKSWRAR